VRDGPPAVKHGRANLPADRMRASYPDFVALVRGSSFPPSRARTSRRADRLQDPNRWLKQEFKETSGCQQQPIAEPLSQSRAIPRSVDRSFGSLGTETGTQLGFTTSHVPPVTGTGFQPYVLLILSGARRAAYADARIPLTCAHEEEATIRNGRRAAFGARWPSR
jgi:hypothetical protein